MVRLIASCSLVSLGACARTAPQLRLAPLEPAQRPELVRQAIAPPVTHGAYVVDAGGRPIRELESGSTLHIGVQGLRPRALYEFRLTSDDGRAVSFARTATDAAGNIEPFVLWYEAGVVGCTARRLDAPNPERFRYRTFEEAEAALQGHSLTVTALQVESNPAAPRVRELKVGEPESRLALPVTRRRNPLVFPSDSSGCLLNANETSTADMYVSGRNFTPGEELEVSVVPNQRAWYVGDRIRDITGPNGTALAERVRVGADGRFTARVWARSDQRNGAYDIVARRLALGRAERLAQWDIVAFDRETAYLLFLTYPPGGPNMDIAGRPLGSTPYFEFADSFAETNDPVWGAVDPTYVPAGHPGGTWAAYYVVNHKSAAQWAVDNTLTDVSGFVEIHPVKGFCVNQTDVIIWNEPLTIGHYDVVVEFGASPANSAATFTGDGHYDPAVDFLDGGVQVGFEVARDPYELGPFAIGADSYSQDDYFPTLLTATNVDLRAVVR